uniref:Uncharacterized protein n=1 Tax=Tanacetum cinerariifolium TaxID=118510 RepID=A0A6L2MMU1_TANCI|nr:hypothetical protein [Tanacetum cinerariifolium]
MKMLLDITYAKETLEIWVYTSYPLPNCSHDSGCLFFIFVFGCEPKFKFTAEKDAFEEGGVLHGRKVYLFSVTLLIVRSCKDDPTWDSEFDSLAFTHTGPEEGEGLFDTQKRLMDMVKKQAGQAAEMAFVKSKKPTKQERKNVRIAKIEEKLGYEMIYVFGDGNKVPEPNKFFLNAEFLGFDGGHQRAPVRIIALKKATDTIFDFT